MDARRPFGKHNAAFEVGQHTRRRFIGHSTALGIGAGAALFRTKVASVAARGTPDSVSPETASTTDQEIATPNGDGLLAQLRGGGVVIVI